MSTASTLDWDVIVVGSGHAGSCAALAAVEAGVPGTRVLIVDKCPAEWAGGNGYFTAGAHRTAHGGLQSLLPLVSNVPAEKASKIDVPPYTAEDFTGDIMRMGSGRNDKALVREVVDESWDAIAWLKEKVGVDFVLSFNRQAYEIDGVQRFWGGMALATRDGGKGLIASDRAALDRAGVISWFEAPAVDLVVEDGCVRGIVVEREGKRQTLRTSAVILAAGGYEASVQKREENLGKGWSEARVRGTPYNTGDGIAIAQGAGAALAGDWEGCHSTCWDAHAARDTGDRILSNQYTKSGYPLGLMLNARGKRFVDEGKDFRNYTYAAFGRAILEQPGGYAFQIYDQRVTKWLRDEEYGDDVAKKVWADSIEELAEKLGDEGLEDKGAFLRTIQEYNSAVGAAENVLAKWDPAVKDALSTGSALPLPKSNWALPLDSAPLLAIKVACGITFTFGGVRIDPETAAVVDKDGKKIQGLYATGEMVGGLWYGNYPGGSGLTAGAVFGRKAGKEAAALRGKAS
ncbi:FAD/NAD-P-binding domain-containing protein [Peniophora sp. CONT]|nr:FAD/NAD-P-binding domain-containing protein [Peniophora sp. CONT]